MEIETKKKSAFDTLFDTAPTQIKTIDPNEYQELVAPPPEKKPYMKEEMSIAQNKDRAERTIFVGNVELKTKRKQLKAYFFEYGPVEKVWIRSVPVVESKKPKKAQVALKQFAEGVDTKVAYVLFETKEGAEKALEANNNEFRGKHIRVTPADKKEQDVKTTIFIGNLSYNAKEEELRRHFSQCGKIASVRMIRDPVTYKGKGFAYIKFAEPAGYLKGLAMNKSDFMDRELRITKAVNMEKKKKMQFKKEKRRVNKFTGPGEEDIVKTKSKIMKEFASKTNFNNDMTDTVADAIFQHRGVVPQSMVGKKIKKLKKKGFSKEKLHQKVLKVKAAAHKQLENDIFNKGDMMKKRREDRKKRQEINAKKATSFKKRANFKNSPNLTKKKI